MKQNSPAEEVKSQVDKQPPSKPASLAEFPLWLVTSFVLALVSLVSLIYYFFVKRSKPALRHQDFGVPQSPEPKQVVETAREGLDIIRNRPIPAAPITGVKEPSQRNPVVGWFESLSSWSFPNLTLDQVKSIIGPVLGLVVAYFAQAVFDSTISVGVWQNWEALVLIPVSTRLWLGAGTYVAAILIWAFTAPAMRSIGSIVNPPAALDSGKTRSSSLRFYLLLAGIIAYLVSVLWFWKNGESGFVRIMWGLGLIFFILSQFPQKTLHPEAEESPHFQWQNWLVLLLILGVGFWLRFYQVATIPDDFHGDMASHGQVARDFLLGIQHDIFGFGWTATPTIGFLSAFLTMAVFGNNIFGLQMAAVIGGTFSLFAVYLLTWRLFNNHRLAAFTTALVAINVAHIHFSRIFNMEPWPLANFAIFLLIDGLKSRRSTSFGLAGVLIGFSLLMYTAGRALPFVILIFLVYALFFQRHWITQNGWGFALLVVGIVVAMGPALIYYISVLDTYIQRSREVFLFSEGVLQHSLSKYNTDSTWIVLLEQIKLSLLMFHQASDTSSQFGYPHPMFNSLISPLIILGMGFALRRWKEAGMIFVLIWLAVITVLGSILTVDAPFWPRLIGIVPAAALLIALAFEQILELGRKTLGSKSAGLITALLVVFLSLVGYLNWQQYYLAVKDSASPSTLTGRYIGRLPLNVTACGIITGPQLTVRETAFLAWPHKLIDIQPDAPDSELAACSGSSIVWAISPENIGRLDAIRARWPNGILDEHYMPRFSYTMTFYLVGVQPPPSSQTDEGFDPFPWIINGISIVAPFFLAGILVLFFFRGVLPKTLDKRRAEGVDFPPATIRQDVPRQAVEAAPTRKEFTWLVNWHNDIRAFVFPAVTPRLVASILLPLVAVGLAYFAQTFLDQIAGVGLHLNVKSLYLDSEGQRQGIAALIFIIAALLWTFSSTDMGKGASQGRTLQDGQPSQLAMGSLAQITGMFFTVSATLIYAVRGETSLVRWLWLAGLVLFFVSLFLKKRSGIEVLKDESPAFRWFHLLTLAILLVLAFSLRVYRLYDIPLDLSTDMASVGINARDYLFGVEHRIFGTGWYYMPRITFLPYATSMAIAGNNLFGLYFATVVMGTLNVLGTYLFVWRLFDRHRLALLTAVLVTINPAHINLSRITSYMDPWFLGFFGLFFLVDGLKGRRWASLALAGVFTGFTLISYPAGRAIIPLIAIGLISFWLLKREWITDNYGGLGWMVLGMLVVLGPNLVYFVTDWSVYMQRSGQVFIFNPGNMPHLKNSYEANSMWMVIWEQIRHSVLQFNYYSDKSAQFSYPHPMFNSLVSPLIFLGFGMSLYRWRKPESLFALSSFLFILTTGSILTIDSPTWVRIVGIIPLAALFIALVMDEFANILERVSLKPFVPLLLAGIALFLWQLGTSDWQIYLRDVSNEDITRPEVHVARYLDTLPDEIAACGITDEYLINQEEIKFMGWPRSIIVVPADTVALTHDLCPGENVVWILAPAYQDRLSELQKKWPGGIAEDHVTQSGWHKFTSYLVTNKTP